VSYVTIFTTQKMDKKTSELGIFFAGNRLKYWSKWAVFLPAMVGDMIGTQIRKPSSLSQCRDITKSMKTWQSPSSKNWAMPERLSV